jgi:membrane associated rhomboid family serine protease
MCYFIEEQQSTLFNFGTRPHRRLKTPYNPLKHTRYLSTIRRARSTNLTFKLYILLYIHLCITSSAFNSLSHLQYWNGLHQERVINRSLLVSNKYLSIDKHSYVSTRIGFSPNNQLQTDIFIYRNFHQYYAAYRNNKWEGDDVRWITKLQRNIQRSTYDWQNQPARNFLLLSNIILFLYQCIDTIYTIRSMYPKSWSKYFITIILDTIMGNSRYGSFTSQFAHSSLLSIQQQQFYRFLTAGFLHGGIIHLLLNMNALRQVPSWIETGLGQSLYITTYLLAIIGGNIVHSVSTLDQNVLCLGASGGICGLYGLMFISLCRMGNQTSAWRLIKGMGLLFLWGMIMTNVSNAAHLGGFLSGIVIAALFGPTYRSSYALRRKNSLEADPYDREYRSVMGYDKLPSSRGMIPVPFLWTAICLAIFSQLSFLRLPVLQRYR